ncbi:hypothetical protein GDO81_007132 [Engystomops pustulosus]|uniref:Tudor domain-containing protein n=1 Tax=Engystomops pustulosus TaxID=76066 RepID=A0AAV7C566_ENGPU|nr:hypothetical protein GDO81_007132 [Engystomops pustulosus]
MDSTSSAEKCNLEMDLKILNISCLRGDILIKFQGKYISDSEFDYHILEREIQLIAKNNEDLDIGQFCLVQDKPNGKWHRGKILDKGDEKFEVALVDQGDVLKVPLPQIATAAGELFTLPPMVVNGIISNLLPLEEKWSPRAVKFFTTLTGQQIHGTVKTFFPHQVVLLEIPKVISYAIELGVAKYVDSQSYCLLVEILHKFPANSHCKQMPDLLQPKEISSDAALAVPDSLPRFQKILDHLRPEFGVYTMEKIKISSALSPDRFFCHVLSWETELDKLTASMCSHYEKTVTEVSSTVGSFGVLCAAKRIDGLWYRGVIQKLISCIEVKVWFIDIGSSETIPSTSVQRLQPEFLSVPMMAIPCALSRNYGQIESRQLAIFKEALMGHVVIGHVKDFCKDERLYYLSLYAKDFEFSGDCHLTNQQLPSFSRHPYAAITEAVIDKKSQNLSTPETSTSIEMEYSEMVTYKSMKMDLESVCIVYVEYVVNPSNFWIRVDDSQKDFTEMMAEIAEKYNKCELMEMVLEDPIPGQLCCALYALDGHYYRAVVTEVLSPQVSVYFIDFGNTETIPFYDVKVLLPQFSVLPALAMCCSLAYAYPVDDVWVKSANDYFKETVNGKPLLCHVLARQKSKYVVEMRLSESSDSSDIVSLLVKAGFAEFWKVDLNSNLINPDSVSTSCNTKSKKPKTTVASRGCRSNGAHVALSALTLKVKPVESSLYSPAKKSSTSGLPSICFKQHIFKPGMIIDVKCSHVDTPASFWCQLSGNMSKLSALMEEMQTFYGCYNKAYQHGQVACVAKSPSTGRYYRAAVVKYVSPREVEVIFIDYGTTERLLFSELCKIEPPFLELEGQAFRCCLSQMFSPSYSHCEWSANASEDFKDLVRSSPNPMKCTVVALVSSGSEELCNAVNLETSFGNANKILTNKGHLVSKKSVPSLHLHTFCYSSFGIEEGSQESVYVTFIYNTGRFYCHLAKNDKIFDRLMKQVAQIGDKLTPAIKPHELCIVKYTEDGNYYRALALPMESSSLFLAFFVDFGDSQMVQKSEILPIPEDTVDILFQPMQAIPCYLAGMKELLLTIEAKNWFEEQYLGKLLRGVVVSRDHEGLLELELYSGNISINLEIQKLFGIKPVTTKVCEYPNGQKNQLRSDSLDPLPVKTDLKLDLKSKNINNQIISCNKNTLKSEDLPQILLEAGTTCLVYASHIDSPSSFFVQLAKQEDEIYQLAEELNKMSFQVIDRKDIEKGLVVVAEYPEDEAYYRAEIKEILKDEVHVEFIDYGNVANVDFSCIFTLPEKFLTIPRLSIPVFLKGFQKLQSHTEWNKNVIKTFSEKAKSAQIICEFVRKHGLQWEVNMTLEGQSLSEELLDIFRCFPKLPAAVPINECIPKSELNGFDISRTTTSDHRLATKTIKPGLIDKVKNICISDCGTLFVTLSNSSEESNLNSHIAAAVQQVGNRLTPKDISEGMVCLAKSEKMQLWLRASVEKLTTSAKKMVVFFVDLGAHETISMHNAKSLPPEALSIPKQAIVCKWSGIEEIDDNVFAEKLKLILQKEIRIIFLEFLESISAWKVEIFVDGLLLLRYLQIVQSSANKKVDGETFSSQKTLLLSQIPRKPLKYLEVYPGFVTFFHDPSSFFIQLEDSVDTMATLSQLMHIPENLTPISADSLKPGFPCLVHSFDKEWCRAEIISINKNFILLYLLDYGVDSILPYSDYGELKMIPTQLYSFPALTYHCALHGVMPNYGKSWSKEAISFCINFVQNHDLMILPVKNLGKNILEVSVYGEGNLALGLVKKGLAKMVEDESISDTMYNFPTIHSKTHQHLENGGYSGESIKSELFSSKESLSPSKMNLHEDGRQHCNTRVSLQRNGAQEW